MDIEQKVIVEPAGKSEADWSAAPRSSTGLPEFVEGEFKRMIELREEPSEAAEGTPPAGLADESAGALGPPADDVREEDELEDAATAQLQSHMTALLEKGGRARGHRAAVEDSSGLIQRIAAATRFRGPGGA